VVRGACGAGKTVAIRGWAATTDQPVVWVTVDASTSAPTAFAAQVLKRVRQLGLGGAADGGASDDPWLTLRESLQDLDEELVVVVDDAGLAEEATLVELCRLLNSAPSLRVIVAENRTTVLDGPGIALLVDRSEVGPLDLMFDESEVARALGLGQGAAEKVHEATSGFPAVIHALAKRGYVGDDESVLAGAFDAVEDYLRLRIRQSGYDARAIDTLVRVSVAEATDAALAVALSQDRDAARVLDEAERFGLGSWSSRSGERLFRFVPFARKLLMGDLRRRHTDDLPRLRRTVVDWLLDRQSPLHALRVAVVAEDLELASRVVKGSWYDLVGKHATPVRELLGDVPMAQLREWPLLVMLLAVSLNGVGVRKLRGLQLFRMAVSAANSDDARLSDSDRVFIWTAESSALRVIGMRDNAGRVALRALKLLIDMPDDAREPHAGELPLICAQLGISLYYAGHRAQALECFAFGAALAETTNPQNGLSCLAMLSGIHALNGDIPDARHYIEIIRSGSWPRAALDGHQGTFYRVAEALLALEESDIPGAEKQVAHLAAQRSASEHWLTIARIEAHVALRAGRAPIGETQLNSLAASRGREGSSSSARRALMATRVQLHLGMGDTQQAAAVLDRDGGTTSTTQIERARVALAENEPGEVLRLLPAQPPEGATSRVRANMLTLRVAALLRLGGGPAVTGDVAALGAILCERALRDPLALLPPMELALTLDALKSAAPCEIGHVESALPAAGAPPKLSPRERIVLRALLNESSVAAVAAELAVSQNTVKTQLKSIYRKLGVSGRDEAIAMALSRNLLGEE
jgi:LuxR family maltose regulon positive regulatory protein